MALLVMTALPGAQTTGGLPALGLPTDGDIRRILAERVNAQGKGVGIIVGIIEPGGRRVISHGQFGEGNPRRLKADTVFEIGSMTKVFTALLLADMVERGEVALEDPIATFLPVGTKLPEWKAQPITLLDLATHTSGLPLMPDDLPPLNELATAQYTNSQLYQFLARLQLHQASGSKWGYSNIGYALLGQALAARSRLDFETLLRTRIIAPLKLERTGIALAPSQNADLAIGHDGGLQPTPAISSVPLMAVMMPAGSVLSTVTDLLTFLSACMSREPSPLRAATRRMLGTRRPASGGEQAMGWMVIGKGDDQLIVHDGGTFGFASSMAWDPERRAGVVVLSNHVADVGDLARHLLKPNYPLRTPPVTKRTEVSVDSAILDSYAGRYTSGDEAFVIAREGASLTIQLPADWGLPTLRLRPESPLAFFVTELPLRVTFQVDKRGQILIHPPRGQKTITASRIQSQK